MNLIDITRRAPLAPWTEAAKIPWDDPVFSERMLREHLAQEHDLASRREELIERHVAWIDSLLPGPSRILDLGCGPGLYARRLAQRGHSCVGIDFSPASIEHARRITEELECEFRHADLRDGDYGAGFDLVMFVFGEVNVFPRQEITTILRAAYEALSPGGLLILEPHTLDGIREAANGPPTWYTAEGGLFSDEPHVVLVEQAWDEDAEAMSQRFFVVDAATGQTTRYSQTVQGYSEEGYRVLLQVCGFGAVEQAPSLEGVSTEGQQDKSVWLARRPESDQQGAP